MAREVSESCLDILLIEMVSSYSNGFYAHKPELVAQAIEAIGYQVGNQLCERFVSPHISPLLHYNAFRMCINQDVVMRKQNCLRMHKYFLHMDPCCIFGTKFSECVRNQNYTQPGFSYQHIILSAITSSNYNVINRIISNQNVLKI